MKTFKVLAVLFVVICATPAMAVEPSHPHELRDAAIIVGLAPLVAVSAVTMEFLGHTVDSRFLIRIPVPSCLSTDNKVKYVQQQNANYSYATYETCI